MLSNYWYWQSGSEYPFIILVTFVGLTSMILVFLILTLFFWIFFNFGNLCLFFPLSLGKILEKEMATHSSVLAWRIPGMGEPGGLPSMGSHRAGHDWSDLAAAAAAALGLRCCAQVFSSCDEWRATLKLWCSGFSLQWLLLLLSTHSRAGLSYSTAGMIFPDQESNPCPLNWQADS